LNQTIINLALALATNELLHNIIEVNGIRSKVARLKAYINGETFKEIPLNIDTRPKAYAIATIAFIVIVGILFGTYSLLDINAEDAFVIIIGLLVASYFATGIMVDKYHVDIEQVTRKFKK
jgi:hypothetical protein